MTKIRVYGYSDDLIEIEKEQNGEWKLVDEIDCYDTEITIEFQDGTVILCGYPKRVGAIWYIKILHTGSADHTHCACNNDDDEIYSDIFIIDLPDDQDKIRWKKSDAQIRQMDKYYSYDDLIKAAGIFADAEFDHPKYQDTFRDIIDRAPVADVSKNAYGEWIEKTDKDDNPFLARKFYCSECGDWQSYGKTKRCFNCGAIMNLSELAGNN